VIVFSELCIPLNDFSEVISCQFTPTYDIRAGPTLIREEWSNRFNRLAVLVFEVTECPDILFSTHASCFGDVSSSHILDIMNGS
jgi:hypothetical protein